MTPDETCKLSEYRENFANAIGAADFAPAKSYKPKQTYQPPNGEHFANETTHLGIEVSVTKSHSDFRSWPIGKSESYKPRSQIFQKSPSDEPFKAETTNKAAYKGVGGEMQNAATRPKSSKDLLKNFSDPTFNAQSTHRSDFTAKDVSSLSDHPKNYRPLPNDGYAPSAPFEAQSTHNADYKPWAAMRQQPIRPRSSRHLMNDGHFEGNSDYADNFKQHRLEPVKSYKPNQDFIPSGHGTEANSSYRDDYVNQPIESTKSFKPVPGNYETPGVFDGSTVYREDFVKRRMSNVCPAQIALSGGNNMYKHVHTDEKGHRWFQIVGLANQSEKQMTIVPPIET
uniref:Uncharacterized protein n=1 Tax=Romanomermis culicivorax TaxID=13658 RepID=A0A915KEC9_ROMCU